MNKRWHWEMIKLITKQAIQYGKKERVLDQALIDDIQRNKKVMINIFKKGLRAEKKLEAAVNQFNYAVGKEEIDGSIYWMNECENEIYRTLQFAQHQLYDVLWKKEK